MLGRVPTSPADGAVDCTIASDGAIFMVTTPGAAAPSSSTVSVSDAGMMLLNSVDRTKSARGRLLDLEEVQDSFVRLGLRTAVTGGGSVVAVSVILTERKSNGQNQPGFFRNG